MSNGVKITPAMRAWCKWLKNSPKNRLTKLSMSAYFTRATGVRYNPTRVMVEKLVAAGLIIWVPNTVNVVLAQNEVMSELTAAGRDAGS